MLFHIRDRYFTLPLPPPPRTGFNRKRGTGVDELPSSFDESSVFSCSHSIPLESMVVDILYPFGFQLLNRKRG